MHNLIDIILNNNNNNNHCNNTMFIDNVGKYMLTPWFKAEYVDSCNIPPPPPLPPSNQPSKIVEKAIPVPSIYSRFQSYIQLKKIPFFGVYVLLGVIIQII